MSEEKNSNMFTNAKLSTIFMVVLGLHVVVIVLISAYHLLKGDSSIEMTQRMELPEPRSYESILTEEADEQSPEVVTAYDQGMIGSGDDNMSSAGLPLPMPAANDPIWTGQAPVTSDVAHTPNELKQDYNVALNTVAPQTSEFRKSPVVKGATKRIQTVEKKSQPFGAVAGTQYTVQKGDTLSGIAARYNLKVSELQKANGLESSMIRIGQKLSLPGVNQLALPSQPAVAKSDVMPRKAAPRATVVSTGTYTVSKGDTLWKISRKFSTTPEKIASLNGITDPSKLRVGDTLKVPNDNTNTGVENSTDMAMMPNR